MKYKKYLKTQTQNIKRLKKQIQREKHEEIKDYRGLEILREKTKALEDKIKNLALFFFNPQRRTEIQCLNK